jgi:hypothetical protein
VFGTGSRFAFPQRSNAWGVGMLGISSFVAGILPQVIRSCVRLPSILPCQIKDTEV